MFYWSENFNVINNCDDMWVLISYIIGFIWEYMIMWVLYLFVDYINLMMCVS